MKNALIALLCAVGLIALALTGALTGLQVVFLDSNRYTALMDELDVYDDVGISREEQTLINGDLADYLAGKIDSLDRPVTLRGEAVSSPFNEREKSHMEDVRRLFQIGMDARAALAVAAVVLLAAGFLLGKRRARRAGILLSLSLMTAVGILAAILLAHADFNALFIRFHELIFSNDLWLLDPATDAMIRMLPEPFFESMATQGVLSAAIGLLIGFLAGAVFLNIPGRKDKA